MRITVLILASLLAGGSAQAAEKFLDGAYGNKPGCVYARSGKSSGADGFFLLNDDGVTTASASCQFSGKATKKPYGFSHRIQCESEGEKGDVETVDLQHSPKGYTVRFSDGTKWGPLPKCR